MKCKRCQGLKKVKCDLCLGKGETAWGKCRRNGCLKGLIDCPRCDGRGKEIEPRKR